MPDTKLLKEIISKSGLTIVAIAEKTGVSRETIYNRLNGKGEFRASEMVALSKVLNMSKEDRDKIFLS